MTETATDRPTDYVPTRRIRPHPNNPKDHDLPKIRASIERFGFTNPLLVCERSGYLAAGHGRLAVVQQMEREWDDADPPPDGIRREEFGSEWLIPVTRGWSSRDDADLMAYVIADNRTGEAGGWIDRMLAEQLRELKRLDDDLPRVAGFEDREMRRLLAGLNVAPPSSPDAFPTIEPQAQFAHTCPRCGFGFDDKPA